MFLYTIVPIQEVMNLTTDEITKQNIVYLNAGSGLLAVEMMEHGKGKIINLLKLMQLNPNPMVGVFVCVSECIYC